MVIEDSVRDVLDSRLAVGDLDTERYEVIMAFLSRETFAFVDPAEKQRLEAQSAAGEITADAFDERLAAETIVVRINVDPDKKRLLDLRYVNGEISNDAYDDILTALLDSARDKAGAEAASITQATTAPQTPKATKRTGRGPVIGIVMATVLLTVVVLGAVGVLSDRGDVLTPEKPPLPVGVTHRPSLIGADEGGWVMQFHNQLDKDLKLYIVIKNKTGRRSKDDNLFLAKYETKELGWMEGWQFSGGETIEIQHPDYKTATWTFE